MAVHDMLMAAGGSSAGTANWVDDVFSTYLYTGNSTSGGTQTITNNIDLSTKGGMVWIKGRSSAANNNLFDTVRGAGTGSASGSNKVLSSNKTEAQGIGGTSDYLSAFSTSGFSVTQGGATTALRSTNYNNVTYASWTFRKQAKFFDVVTYTGTGSNTTIPHNLGSVPGCIIVKRTDTSGAWQVYHRSLANTEYMVLNTTAAKATGATRWNSTTPTSSVFSLGTDTTVNANGGTYVAYLFAHNAGGFGTAGTDNVISCGSYTGNGSASGQTISLGYEPQWLLIKNISDTSGYAWLLVDNMRGMNENTAVLLPNTNEAEWTTGNYLIPNGIGATATGFYLGNNDGATNASGQTYIYIAIRRPMKPPTTGTEVFKPVYGTSSAPAYNSGFVSDAFLGLYTAGDASYPRIGSRLTGTNWMKSSGTEAEATDGIITWDYMNGVYNGYLDSGYVGEIFRRAPGFFDVVCFTGTSSSYAVNHNLGVVPELIISKDRGNVTDWDVWAGNVLGSRGGMILNLTNANNPTYFNSGSAATSTQFYTRVQAGGYTAGANYVAYLFATLPGVSKVGSYTGTGTTNQINCGFTGGARFVLIKRTDSTGDWYVWDSARGIVSGNDPYQLINTNNAQVTNTDYIDPYSAGFEISSTAPAAINASGGSFIFLAIA